MCCVVMRIGQVTYLEAAIVQPYWTSLLVCYVEGDSGHLLGEDAQQQKWRTRVRGTAHSFQMPWEDIVAELQDHCDNAASHLERLPLRPECLKYVLKVHLRVDKHNMSKVLRQLTVRPFVLLQLLYFLIEHNHEAFRNKGSVAMLREQMEKAVASYYPVSAQDLGKPLQEQKSNLPSDLVEFSKPVTESRKAKTVAMFRDKASTPGDGGADHDDCLRHNRPATVNPGVSSGSLTDPASARTNAIIKHGDLQVQTGHEMLSQWETKYFSQILPFVMPFMVSGPDFDFHNKAPKRWRRKDNGKDLEAPWVSPQKFCAGFARRCESQCRHDWTALPIIRSVCFRWAVETGNTMVSVPTWWKRGSAMDPSAKQPSQMAKRLCEVLWSGHIRYGNIKVPLNGDTTRLHMAEGLTPAEKQLARRIGFVAGHFQARSKCGN